MRSKNGPSDDDKCCHEDAVTCHASRAMTAPVTAVSGGDAARKELGHLDCAATVMVTAPRSGRRAGNRALVRDVCHI